MNVLVFLVDSTLPWECQSTRRCSTIAKKNTWRTGVVDGIPDPDGKNYSKCALNKQQTNFIFLLNAASSIPLMLYNLIHLYCLNTVKTYIYIYSKILNAPHMQAFIHAAILEQIQY